ncbi:hypothetical protein [Mucilaginibacter antarcticus]|uniref:Uncharacterized protein n=1 Tax=Mucilaginibacter antarcticus TaxID=1855725 RepID=A0ABW5XS84_9SPHI
METLVLNEIFKYTMVDVLDYTIFNSNLNQLRFNTKCLISRVNQYSYRVAEKDADVKPDGVGIVAAAKMLNGETVKKIAGADIHQHAFFGQLGIEFPHFVVPNLAASSTVYL